MDFKSKYSGLEAVYDAPEGQNTAPGEQHNLAAAGFLLQVTQGV